MYRVDGMITVDTLPINVGESVTIDFFCPEAPTTVIGSLVVEGPIAVATPTAISALVPAGCAGQELIARIVADESGNCVCEDVATTFNILPEVIVDAGLDATICGTDELELSNELISISGGVEDGEWSTSGDGEFLNAMGTPTIRFSEVISYSPGPLDKQNGQVILTLSSDPPGNCTPVTDSLLLTILRVDCGTFPWQGND